MTHTNPEDQKMRKLKIDLGLIVTVEVPEGMSDYEACGHVFDAAGGKGDPRDGVNMNAEIPYYVGKQIGRNLKNTGSPVKEASGIELCVKVQGDLRTPRQRALDARDGGHSVEVINE